MAKVLNLQHQSLQYSGLTSFRMDWLDLLGVQGTLKSSPTPQFKSIRSSVFSFLYGPTLITIHDYWKNHRFFNKVLIHQGSPTKSYQIVKELGKLNPETGMMEFAENSYDKRATYAKVYNGKHEYDEKKWKIKK